MPFIGEPVRYISPAENSINKRSGFEVTFELDNAPIVLAGYNRRILVGVAVHDMTSAESYTQAPIVGYREEEFDLQDGETTRVTVALGIDQALGSRTMPVLISTSYGVLDESITGDNFAIDSLLSAYLVERPTLNGIRVISPKNGEALRATIIGYSFYGLDSDVVGKVRASVVSRNYANSYGAAEYQGVLGGTHTLRIPVDLGAERYDDGAHIVATITADGYIGTSDVVDVRLVGPTEASVEIIGAVETGGAKRITSWPATVAGTLYDSVDGPNPPTMSILVYNETTGESGSGTFETAQDGSFSLEIDESSHVRIGNGDSIWLRVRGRNSLGLDFSADSDYYLVDIHAPSVGSASFEDVLDDGSVKVTFYAYDDDPLTPELVGGSIYAARPDGQLKLLKSWDKADWDRTQGVITATNEFCAVNEPVRYVFEAWSANGDKSSLTSYHTLVSPYFYMHWGQGRGRDAVVTRARWHTALDWDVKPANVELTSYMGRALPVMSRTRAYSDSTSLSYTCETREEAERIRSLCASAARCYFRGPDGSAFHAFVTVKGSVAVNDPGIYGTITLSMTKIDGSIR